MCDVAGVCANSETGAGVKRRPTSRDRDLAEWIDRLTPGRYAIDVTKYLEQISGSAETRYLGRARLKREGGLVIDDTYKRIEIYPSGAA